MILDAKREAMPGFVARNASVCFSSAARMMIRFSLSSSARLSRVCTASAPQPVALPVTLVHQAVRLVDEQHPAERRVDQVVGLDGGRAQVLAHQVGALRLDHLRGVEQAEGVEDLADHPGHGGLARSWRPEEDEVPHRPVGAEAGHRPAARRLDGHGDRADLLLDRPEPDHRFEFGERLLGGDHRLGRRDGGLRLTGRVVGEDLGDALRPGAVLRRRVAAAGPRHRA